jgi:peptide/nickel transport system permease protein
VTKRSEAPDIVLQEIKPRRGRALIVRSLLKSKLALIGMVIIVLAGSTALAAPLLAPSDPAKVAVAERLQPPMWQEGGTADHILGTDSLGRDILSRMIYGARVSLLVGCVSVFLAGLIGVSLGLVAGYVGGWPDVVLMRIADIQMAFPFILLAITLMAVLGSSLGNIIFTLAITGWVQYARMVRGQVLSIREKEFVDAARCVGVPRLRIMWRHVLPNTVSPIIVLASFGVSAAIIAEAGLSFLGLGVPLSVPSWGAMLSQAREVQSKAWWPAFFPGMAITATVFGINVVGDWLRDVLDPHLRIG